MFRELAFALIAVALISISACGGNGVEHYDDREMAWSEYQVSKITYLEAHFGINGKTDIQAAHVRNQTAHKRLIELGEIVLVSDPVLVEKIESFGINEIMSGSEMIGGQNAPGTKYFASYELAIFKKHANDGA